MPEEIVSDTTFYLLERVHDIDRILVEGFFAINKNRDNCSDFHLLYPENKKVSSLAALSQLRRLSNTRPLTEFYDIYNGHTIELSEKTINLQRFDFDDFSRMISEIVMGTFTPTFFELDRNENKFGHDIQQHFKIPIGQPFVTIYSGKRLNSLYKMDNNSKLEFDDFLPAIQYLNSLGYEVVWLGDFGGLEPPERPGLKSIQTLIHADGLADLWFSTRCEFFISSNNGPFHIPLVFNGPPRLLVNWAGPAPFSINNQDRQLPQHLRLEQHNQRLATFRERMFIEPELHRTAPCDLSQLSWSKNTGEDILAAVIEMVTQTRSGDKHTLLSNHQQHYYNIASEWHKLKKVCGEDEPCFSWGPPVCNSFLESYPEMLG